MYVQPNGSNTAAGVMGTGGPVAPHAAFQPMMPTSPPLQGLQGRRLGPQAQPMQQAQPQTGAIAQGLHQAVLAALGAG